MQKESLEETILQMYAPDSYFFCKCMALNSYISIWTKSLWVGGYDKSIDRG